MARAARQLIGAGWPARSAPIALTIVPFVMVAIPVAPTRVAVAMLVALIAAATIAFAVLAVSALMLESRHVFIVVPVIAHEVDAPAASIVLSTMLTPVPLMAGRHMQVNRLGRNEFRRLSDYHWL